MKILLTGANGYIGQRLLPLLINQGHTVVCCVRDGNRFSPPEMLVPHIEVIEVDFLKKETLDNIPHDIDGAYYLIHSMSGSQDFSSLEKEAATNFKKAIQLTMVRHVIYLTGIVNEDQLSEHLESRKTVETVLSGGSYHFTALRAGIIIGSGSASFEIIRDLVEKLPLMITPKWVKIKCQPIGIREVLEYLERALFNEFTYDKSFDIYGPDILTYKEMMLQYADVRRLKRYMISVPVMTPRLSSYWLYFVTSTSYNLAVSLVDSMKVNVVAEPNTLGEMLNVYPADYRTTLKRAFAKIDQNAIVSSWKDSFVSGSADFRIEDFINVPEHGCFIDKRPSSISDRDSTINKIWKIGGKTGWYYATWLWKVRGYLDKMVGGVGLRRGRTHLDHIDTGDAIDFWRVLVADKQKGRLLLYAEMKLPGEAWLEFSIKENTLIQTATFRPVGILGRLYWYAVLPFHGFIFNGMINALTSDVKSEDGT